MAVCSRLKKGLHFSQDSIRACCSPVLGPIFEKNYSGGSIDFDKMDFMRKSLISKIEQGIIPYCCKDCSSWNEDSCMSKKDDFRINFVQFNHYTHCNCSCIYCNNVGYSRDFVQCAKKSNFYDVMPILLQLDKLKKFDDYINVLITGGEPTCLQEFDDILNFFQDKNAFIIVFSSGIEFNQKIADLMSENKLRLVVSLDCGSEKSYEKIKRVDKFSQVVENLKKYSNFQSSVVDSFCCVNLKYIFLKDINDNISEIDSFFEIVKRLNIKDVQPDFDNSPLILNQKIPQHFEKFLQYFSNKASSLNLRCELTERLKNCIAKGFYV